MGVSQKSTAYNIRSSHHHATKCFLGGTERRPGGAPTCSRQETPAWASPQKARFTISALATTMQPTAFWKARSAAQAERRLAVGRRRPHGRLPKSTVYNIRTIHNYATNYFKEARCAHLQPSTTRRSVRPHGRLPKSTVYNIRTIHNYATNYFKEARCAHLQPSTTRRSVRPHGRLPKSTTPQQNHRFTRLDAYY